VDVRHRLEAFELDVSFRTTGGITALFGPSGAGKSLTLRHVAGLAAADQGRIVLGDRVLFDSGDGVNVPPRRRQVGLVFQDYALFPHLSVGSNIAYGLSGWPRPRREERVEALLRVMGLEGYGPRDPGSLSGGERQRVALARALAPEPRILLLDEPFGALDFRVRRGLRSALLDLHDRTGVPMVLVTHSLSDVRELSDTLVLLDRGRVLNSGGTDSLLEDPGSEEAAALLQARDLA